jgi:hypothetical protein
MMKPNWLTTIVLLSFINSSFQSCCPAPNACYRKGAAPAGEFDPVGLMDEELAGSNETHIFFKKFSCGACQDCYDCSW